jgi:hypothetical protein
MIAAKLCAAARRADTAVGHHRPQLEMLVRLGKRVWLHCDSCRHSIMIEPHELAQRYRLDVLKPLLMISKAMHCALRGAEGLLLAGAARYARTTKGAY